MINLPDEFADLKPWSEWCLKTETERNHHRVDQSFERISAFAEAILPRLGDICHYIDDNLSTDEGDATHNLYYMLLSLAEVAPAIESYDPEVEVVDGYDTKRFIADENHRLRPAI